MEEFTISIGQKEYTIHPQRAGEHMIYVLKACDADIVFTTDNNGHIFARDQHEPAAFLQTIATAIESSLG